MGWLPEQDMWLTHVRVNERADLLTHDLRSTRAAFGQPDPIAAGLARPIARRPPTRSRGSPS